MSNIVKDKNAEVNNAEQFFDEGVFYPRLDRRHEEIQNSKLEAMRIIQEAEEQAIAHLGKFKELGIQDGIKKLEPLTAQLTSLIDELNAYKEMTIAALEPVVTDLIVRAAKKVIKDELKTNVDIIKNNVIHALSTIVDKEEVLLMIHPDDLEIMDEYQNNVMASFREIKKMTLEANDTIARGGCYIKTNRGDLDATIETQFAKIAAVFNADIQFNEE